MQGEICCKGEGEVHRGRWGWQQQRRRGTGMQGEKVLLREVV